MVKSFVLLEGFVPLVDPHLNLGSLYRVCDGQVEVFDQLGHLLPAQPVDELVVLVCARLELGLFALSPCSMFLRNLERLPVLLVRVCYYLRHLLKRLINPYVAEMFLKQSACSRV